MATPVADRAVLDTNVLLSATDVARPEHERAMAAINMWPASGVVLYTSGPRRTLECSGKQVHDANVVATMLVHGIGTVVTSNVAEFASLVGHVRVVDLRA